MRRARFWLLVLVVLIFAAAIVLHLTHWSAPVLALVTGKKTVEDRLDQYGRDARARLAPWFDAGDVAYPPARVVLVGLKEEKHLELYASADETSALKLIRSYAILAASGTAGPKLKRGDRQVPEGFYRIESLNPNSRFHLALRVNYPSEFDREIAASEGRTDLGSDIMIHGKSVSVGCLAMGDAAAEELFVLAADTGLANLSLILSPRDFRVNKRVPVQPKWLDELYERIDLALVELSKPE